MYVLRERVIICAVCACVCGFNKEIICWTNEPQPQRSTTYTFVQYYDQLGRRVALCSTDRRVLQSIVQLSSFHSMSSTPREIGTLIVVVLKAVRTQFTLP